MPLPRTCLLALACGLFFLMSPHSMTLPPINVRQHPSGRFFTFALVMLGACGCGETEQIRRYDVPKQAATPSEDLSSDVDEVMQFETQPTTAWFLKLTGPAEAVAPIEEDFQELVKSTTISGGEPQWTLPEGWSQQSGSGMRFATLSVNNADPPLEVSVIKLPYQGNRDSYLQENINRWRGQLGLSAITGADWLSQGETSGEVQSLTADDRDTTLVDLHGKTEDFPDARMLAAILLPTGTATASAPDTPNMTPQAASITPPVQDDSSPITYEAPEEWQPGKKSVMRVAAFLVTDGDKQVEVTVIPAGGDVLSNVNRWRGQVGLEPWSDAEFQKVAEEWTVDGQVATYVNLPGKEQTILAAIRPGEPQSWFFKLTGDPDLARREADRFKAFVESVTFK